MKVALDRVAKGQNDRALPPISLTFRTGEVTLARAETEQRPTVLGLIASGRMRPDSGSVTIDGEVDYPRMRERIALIDAPAVCEPASDVTVRGVVAEELMFAGRPSNPIAVNRAIASLGVGAYAKYSIGTVPPTVRIGMLAELALLRRDVQALVITSPDRHGGDPNEWWQLARELADRDVAILIVAGDASAAAIGAATLVDRLTATDAGQPERGETFDEDPGRDDTDQVPDTVMAPGEHENEEDRA